MGSWLVILVGDLRLVLRGMWFRRGVSLAVLVLASLVVGGAVTGPLFLRSAGESVLRDTLDQALEAILAAADRVPPSCSPPTTPRWLPGATGGCMSWTDR